MLKKKVFHATMRKAVGWFIPGALVCPYHLLNTFLAVISACEASLATEKWYWFISTARGIYSYLHPCFFIAIFKISMVVIDTRSDDLWSGNILGKGHHGLSVCSTWFLLEDRPSMQSFLTWLDRVEKDSKISMSRRVQVSNQPSHCFRSYCVPIAGQRAEDTEMEADRAFAYKEFTVGVRHVSKTNHYKRR